LQPRLALLACLAGIAAACVACGDADAPASPGAAASPPSPNLLVYVVDTLRADSLGVYGGELARTPHIDAFAASGVTFTEAFANSSWTRPSMASLLTGLYPTRHAANTRAAALPTGLPTLGELLSAHGYRTGFITTNPNVGSFFGFARGFDETIELYGRREAGVVDESELITRADAVTARAVEWIDAAPRPFALVVHTIDPHAPFDPPPAFDVYGDGPSYTEILYAGEVAFADAAFGDLLDALRSRGLLDAMLVVFTADHGEEFFEYGRIGHGESLSDPVLRIPLIVRFPASSRVVAGRREARVAELVDVVPSVLDLLGLASAAPTDGASLFASAPPGPSLSTLRLEGRDLRAAVEPPWKLVHDVAAGASSLYDLEAGEKAPSTAAGASAARERLTAALDALGEASPATLVSPGDLDEQGRAALRALGYVE
jgi:arylsulfatase A-like enzyme